MRHAWIFAITISVLVLVACRQQEEPITTAVPKGWTQAASLQRGNWKAEYNFELGDALKDADRSAEEAPAVKTAPESKPMLAVAKLKNSVRRIRKVAKFIGKPNKKKLARNSTMKASLLR